MVAAPAAPDSGRRATVASKPGLAPVAALREFISVHAIVMTEDKPTKGALSAVVRNHILECLRAGTPLLDAPHMIAAPPPVV